MDAYVEDKPIRTSLFAVLAVIMIAVVVGCTNKQPLAPPSTPPAAPTSQFNTVQEEHQFTLAPGTGPGGVLALTGSDAYYQDPDGDGQEDYIGYNPGVYLLSPSGKIRTLALPRPLGRSSNIICIDKPAYSPDHKRLYAVVTYSKPHGKEKMPGNRVKMGETPVTLCTMAAWNLSNGTAQILYRFDKKTGKPETAIPLSLTAEAQEAHLAVNAKPARFFNFDTAHEFTINGRTWTR